MEKRIHKKRPLLFFVFMGAMLLLFSNCGGGGSTDQQPNDGPDVTKTPINLQSFTNEAELTTYLTDQYAQSAMSTDSYGAMRNTPPELAPVADGGAAGGLEGDDSMHSGTNVQEAGVDEADRVKTDGTYLYVSQGNQVAVADIRQPMQQVAQIAVKGFIEELYLADDHLVILYTPAWQDGAQRPPWLPDGMAFDVANPRDSAIGAGLPFWIPTSKTGVAIFDLSDPTAPKQLNTVEIDGILMASRRIGSTLHVVTQFIPNLETLDLTLFYNPEETTPEEVAAANEAAMAKVELEDLVPGFERFDNQDALIEKGPAVVPGNLFFAPHRDGGGTILNVNSFDLKKPDEDFKTVGIVADAHTIYCSTKALYAVSGRYRYDAAAETTIQESDIYKFDLTEEAVVPAGSGSVAGLPLNQFSMGEHEGVLRIATTIRDVNFWVDTETDQSQNLIYCLQETVVEEQRRLEVVGKIEKIAPGEQIYAVRFLGQRGFVITFRQIDPLFTVDLSDPTKPAIVGELKIPGFSTYLHPYGENHLVAIGFAGDDSGVRGGLEFSLFDVSNFAKPQRIHTEAIGEGWSEATGNHKAFTFWNDGEQDLLAIPLVSYNPDPKEMEDHIVRLLKVYSVSTQEGFTPMGAITFSSPTEDFGIYGAYIRGIFVDEDVLGINPHEVHRAVVADMENSVETLVLK